MLGEDIEFPLTAVSHDSYRPSGTIGSQFTAIGKTPLAQGIP